MWPIGPLAEEVNREDRLYGVTPVFDYGTSQTSRGASNNSVHASATG